MEPRLPLSPLPLISGSGSWPQLSLSRSLLPQKHKKSTASASRPWKKFSSTCRQVYMEPYGFLHKKTSMESCLFYMNSCTLQTSCRATHFFVTFRFLFFHYQIFQLTLLSLEPKNNTFFPQRRGEWPLVRYNRLLFQWSGSE